MLFIVWAPKRLRAWKMDFDEKCYSSLCAIIKTFRDFQGNSDETYTPASEHTKNQYLAQQEQLRRECDRVVASARLVCEVDFKSPPAAQ